MTIISSEITQDELQANGERVLRYSYTDHLGVVIIIGPITISADGAPTFDANTDMLSRIPAIEDAAAWNEVKEVFAQFEIDAELRDIDPSQLTDWSTFHNPPDYQPGATAAEQGYALSRRVLGRVMTIKDIDVLREAYAFFLAHQSRDGGNKNFRADNIGVSRVSYSDVDAHLSTVAGILTFVDDKKGRVWDDIPDEWQT